MGIIIGIDPDLDKNGVALYYHSTKQLSLQALTFYDLVKLIESESHNIKTIYVEAGWLNSISNYHGGENKRVTASIGVKVGQNQGVGKTIVSYLRESGLEVIERKPLKKIWGKSKKEKISHVELMTLLKNKQIACNHNVTNQEMRDAALIIPQIKL